MGGARDWNPPTPCTAGDGALSFGDSVFPSVTRGQRQNTGRQRGWENRIVPISMPFKHESHGQGQRFLLPLVYAKFVDINDDCYLFTIGVWM